MITELGLLKPSKSDNLESIKYYFYQRNLVVGLYYTINLGLIVYEHILTYLEKHMNITKDNKSQFNKAFISKSLS